MKRRMFKLVLFLLLGAIVNIAVVWGLVLGDNHNNLTLQMGIEQLEGNYKWTVDRFENPWFIFIQSHLGEIVIYGDRPIIEASALVEGWGHVPNRNDISGEPGSWEENACGWPFIALWSRVTELDPMHDVGVRSPRHRVLPKDILEKGVLLDWSFWSSQQYVLPIGLIWPGFAINTLFYAAILWSLTLGPFTARRMIRRKRGRCIKCGYDLRGDTTAGCPECGWGREAEA